MWFRQIFGGCRRQKNSTDGVPSHIWGLYTPKIFDGCDSVKHLGAVDPPKYFTDGVPSNIWGLYTPKYFTDVVPSNIWGVYTPKISDGWGSVIYLGGLHPQNISRMGFGQIFGNCRPPKYLTDVVPSNFLGL